MATDNHVIVFPAVFKDNIADDGCWYIIYIIFKHGVARHDKTCNNDI